jgi:hypothetical protein
MQAGVSGVEGRSKVMCTCRTWAGLVGPASGKVECQLVSYPGTCLTAPILEAVECPAVPQRFMKAVPKAAQNSRSSCWNSKSGGLLLTVDDRPNRTCSTMISRQDSFTCWLPAGSLRERWVSSSAANYQPRDRRLQGRRSSVMEAGT